MNIVDYLTLFFFNHQVIIIYWSLVAKANRQQPKTGDIMPNKVDNNRSAPRKGRGFAGQKIIAIPQKIISQLENDALLNSLFLTRIGYFPNAKFHYRDRKEGINEYILIHCVDGKGWYEINGERFHVEPNILFILPEDIPHRYGADAEDPWSIYWIHFAGTMAKKFTSSMINFADSSSDNHPSQFIPHLTARQHIFHEIYQALERGYSTDNLGYANTCLWHFLGSLCFSNTYEWLKSDKDKEENDLVEASISCMKEHLHTALSLEDLAHNVHYSPSYFSTLFKKETGYSPIDYFIHLKIQKACQYLDLTNLNINEISLKTGYDDSHYFSRLFHKIMGLSPTEYRKKQKG